MRRIGEWGEILTCIASFVAIIWAMQQAGLGADLLAQYPYLWIDSPKVVFGYVIVFGLTRPMFGEVIFAVWDRLTPIKNVTYVETFGVIYVGSLAGVLFVSACFLRFDPASLLTVLIATAVAALPDAIWSAVIALREDKKISAARADGTLESPSRELHIKRQWTASFAAAFAISISSLLFVAVIHLWRGQFTFESIWIVAKFIAPFALIVGSGTVMTTSLGFRLMDRLNWVVSGERTDTAIAYVLGASVSVFGVGLIIGLTGVVGGGISITGLLILMATLLAFTPLLTIGGLVYGCVATKPEIVLTESIGKEFA